MKIKVEKGTYAEENFHRLVSKILKEKLILKVGDQVRSKEWGHIGILKQDGKLYNVEGHHEIGGYWRTASGTLEQIKKLYEKY